MSQNKLQSALVVAAFGRHWHLRNAAGDRLEARARGRRLRPVCGDRVVIEPLPNEAEWLITEVLPRDNELTRPNTRGEKEILVANITLLAVVAADPPKPDWFIVDRYLCAAELLGIDALVINNKSDLPERASVTEALAGYASIGYQVLRCSVHQPQSLDALANSIAGQVAVMVGQSGVGKSSLINQLSAQEPLSVGEVSTKTGEGRHTTVHAALLSLPGGGAVIDSPGVRDYAPSIAELRDVARGYREIAAAGEGCKYANCRHTREPRCDVKAAVNDGRIDARRYASYKRLLNITQQLLERAR